MIEMPNQANKPIHVALLDDHDVALHGFASILAREIDFLVVGMYRRSEELFAGLRHISADVLVVDYALGPKEVDGLNLIRALRSQYADSRILVASGHCNPSTVSLVMRAGGHGFIAKTQDLTDLVKAIRLVAAGDIYVSPLMTKSMLGMTSLRHIDIADAASDTEPDDLVLRGVLLTPREKEVVRCFLAGMTVTEIAGKFMRSPKTISTQKSFAFKKLGIRNDSDFFKLREQLERLS